MRLLQREESLAKALKVYDPPSLDRHSPCILHFKGLQLLLMLKLEKGHDQVQIWLWAVDQMAGHTTKIQIVTLQTQELAYKIPLTFQKSKTFRLYHNKHDYYALEIRDPLAKSSEQDLVFCLALTVQKLREKQIGAYKLSLGHFRVDRIKWHPQWINYLLVLQGSSHLEIFNIHKNIKLPEMRLDLTQFYLEFLERHPEIPNLPKKIQVVDFALPNSKFFEDLVNFSLILLSSSGLVFCINPLLLQFSNISESHRQAYLRLRKNVDLNDLDQDIVRQITQSSPTSPFICLRPNLQNYAHKLLAMRLMLKANPKKAGQPQVKPNLRSQFDRVSVLQDSKGLILILSKNSNQRGYSSVQVFYSLSSIFSGLNQSLSPKIIITKIYSCKLHSDPPPELKLAKEQHSPQIIMREKARLFIRSFSHIYCLQIQPLLSFDGTLSIHSDSTMLQKRPAVLRLIVKADAKEKECQQGYFLCMVNGFQVCLGRKAKQNQFFCLSTQTQMNLDYLTQLIKDFNFLIEKQERKLKAEAKSQLVPPKLQQPTQSFFKSIQAVKEWQSKFTTVMGQLVSRLQFKFTKVLELQKKYEEHKSNSTAVYNRMKTLYDSVREKAELIKTLQSNTKSKAVHGLSTEEIQECRNRVRILSMRFEQYKHLLKQINIEKLCKDQELQQVRNQLQRIKAQMRTQ